MIFVEDVIVGVKEGIKYNGGVGGMMIVIPPPLYNSSSLSSYYSKEFPKCG